MELIIFIGLQASGKSSFYRQYFSLTHQLISKDLIKSQRPKEKVQGRILTQALMDMKNVVIDNTNPSRAVRAPLLILGKKLGARIIGYYFVPHLPTNLQRNRQRLGKAKVPDIALYATLKNLEIPSYDEGFDELYQVQTTAGETGLYFEVRPLLSSAP